MDLKRFRYFARIAEDGSMTKAAGVLRIAQPALSRQMRLLEDDLGVTLFNRTARGMRLTEDGEYLLASLSGPLREIDLAIGNLRASGHRIEGQFAIGLPLGVGDLVGVRLATMMRIRHPDVRLRLVESVSGSLLDWLTRGILDFALLEEPSNDPRLIDRPLFDAPLMLVGREAGADEASPTLRQVAKLPLVLPSHHIGIRGTLNLAAAAKRLTLMPAIEADSPRLALGLVRAGMGHAVLPACLVDADGGETPALQPIEHGSLGYRLCLSFRNQTRFLRGRSEARVLAIIGEAMGAAVGG